MREQMMKRLGVCIVGFLMACNTGVGPDYELPPKQIVAPPTEPPVVIVPSKNALFPHTLPKRPRALEATAAPAWTSGRALAVHEDLLFAVDSDNDRLVIMDRFSGTIQRSIAVGDRPHHVVVDDQGRAFVSLRHDGEVVRIDAQAATVSEAIAVGVEPMGLALSPDGNRLYVAIRGDNTVALVSANAMTEIHRTTTGLNRPEALSVNETHLVVAQAGTDTVEFTLSPITGVMTETGIVARALNAALPWDMAFSPERPSMVTPNRARAVAFHPETQASLVVHNQSLPGDPMTAAFDIFLKGGLGEDEPDVPGDTKPVIEPSPGNGGGGYGSNSIGQFPGLVRPIETVVSSSDPNTEEGTPEEKTALPIKTPGDGGPLTAKVAQPTDIHHHPTWTMAFVTGYGSDNVLVLNTAHANPMRYPIGLINVGQAPKAIAFSNDGQWAYVLNHHSFDISVIDLAPVFEAAQTLPDLKDVDLEQDMDGDMLTVLGPLEERMIPIVLQKEEHALFSYGTDPLPESARIGRRLYTFVGNAEVNSDARFACASCHFEGTEDQLVWATPEGMRQTPALAGRLHDTAPYNWGATEATLAGNMAETIDRMDGEGLTDEELASLEEFLIIGLERPMNPHRLASGLTPEQLNGKALFNDPTVGCAGCHSGPDLADGNTYDVGTADDMELELQMLIAELMQEELQPIKLNTPSLRDLFATAPYFHNGTAETLMDVLDRTSTTMGNTSHLSFEQKQDLVAYLKTL